MTPVLPVVKRTVERGAPDRGGQLPLKLCADSEVESARIPGYAPSLVLLTWYRVGNRLERLRSVEGSPVGQVGACFRREPGPV